MFVLCMYIVCDLLSGVQSRSVAERDVMFNAITMCVYMPYYTYCTERSCRTQSTHRRNKTLRAPANNTVSRQPTHVLTVHKAIFIRVEKN